MYNLWFSVTTAREGHGRKRTRAREKSQYYFDASSSSPWFRGLRSGPAKVCSLGSEVPAVCPMDVVMSPPHDILLQWISSHSIGFGAFGFFISNCDLRKRLTIIVRKQFSIHLTADRFHYRILFIVICQPPECLNLPALNPSKSDSDTKTHPRL